MKFEDKYHLTPDENKRYAKANLARLVFANSRFEGLSTTLPQTETIVAGLVGTYRGDFVPPEVINEENEEKYLKDLNNSNRSITDKALTLMFHNMRQKMFWDENKRSATLAANKLMIENGVGLIAVPEDKYLTFLKKISDYYFSNDMNEVKEWTYKNGVQGITPKHEKNFKSKLDPSIQKYLD